MNDTQNAPSLSQAQRLKKLVQEGHFSYDVAFAVMGEEKKDELDKVVIKNDTLRKYFPRSYTPETDGGHHHQTAGTVAAQTAAAE